MGSRALAWLLVATWFALFCALQAAMAASPRFGLATPDLCVVLLVSLAGAVRRADLAWLALVAALARKSFSLDPPSAILALTLAIAGLAWLLRALFDLRNPLWRSGLAALCASGACVWLELVRSARDRAPAASAELAGLWPPAWTSALAALACGGLLAHLPGLAPLRSKR